MNIIAIILLRLLFERIKKNESFAIFSEFAKIYTKPKIIKTKKATANISFVLLIGISILFIILFFLGLLEFNFTENVYFAFIHKI